MKKVNLKKLQDQNLPHATVRSLPLSMKWAGKGKMTEKAKTSKKKFIKAMNEYLKDFLPSKDNVPCVNCEEPQGGWLGCFQWGIAHGEGYCSGCGYPARGFHYIEKIVKGEWKGDSRLSLVLQYHPDVLKRKKEVKE